jgi:CheY-like chemotaxis protein
VRRALESRGFAVLEATDGPGGLAMVRKAIPPLILLDIGLPGMDGVEILGYIRADEKLRHIPVIVVTASVMSGDRERFIAAGCDDYLSKPIDVPKLLEKVAQYYPKE